MHVVETAIDPLFAGVDSVINARLGVRNYRTKTAARGLSALTAAPIIDGAGLVDAVFEVLHANWHRALPRARASSQNFRWRVPQLNCAVHNMSPEVTLERAFISVLEKAGRCDWANQVPIISGIAGSRAYKRRAVDLVRCLPDDGGFEFVELKVASDTPLFAAMEVLIYGLLWLLSRESRTQLGYRSNPILDAPALQLSTLAPAPYYRGLPIFGLANALDHGVGSLGRKHGVAMGFRAMAFPEGFRWSMNGDLAELVRWFDARTPVLPCD